MNTINAVLTSIADLFFSLVASWPPLLTLSVISAISGVLMAIVFRYTSPQQALRQVADLSRAQVLAIKLFKDELGGIFSSLRKLFYYTGLRLCYSLPPALVMVVPFVLLLVQLSRWYEYEPLSEGAKAIVVFQLSEDAWPDRADFKLTPAASIEIETEPLQDLDEKAIYWRIRVATSEPASIGWELGNQHGEKRIATSSAKQSFCAVDPRRPGTGIWDRALHPGEPGFGSDSAVASIAIDHLPRETPILGMHLPWWLTFLIVSMVAAVLVRPLVGVQF